MAISISSTQIRTEEEGRRREGMNILKQNCGSSESDLFILMVGKLLYRIQQLMAKYLIVSDEKGVIKSQELGLCIPWRRHQGE